MLGRVKWWSELSSHVIGLLTVVAAWIFFVYRPGVTTNMGATVILSMMILFELYAVIRLIVLSVERLVEEELWYDGFDSSGGSQREAKTHWLRFILPGGKEKTISDTWIPRDQAGSMEPGWYTLRIGARTRELHQVVSVPANRQRERPLPYPVDFRQKYTLWTKAGQVYAALLLSIIGIACSGPVLFIICIADWALALKIFAFFFSSPMWLGGLWLLKFTTKWMITIYKDVASPDREFNGILVRTDLHGKNKSLSRQQEVKLTVAVDGRTYVLNTQHTFPWEQYEGHAMRFTALAGSLRVVTASVAATS